MDLFVGQTQSLQKTMCVGVCLFVLWEMLAKIFISFLPIGDLQYKDYAFWQSDRSDFFQPDSLSHVILNRSKALSLDLSLNSHVRFILISTSQTSNSRHYSSRRGRSLWSVSLRTLSDDIKYWKKLFTNSNSFLPPASASALTSVYSVHCVWHRVVVPTSVFSLVT